MSDIKRLSDIKNILNNSSLNKNIINLLNELIDIMGKRINSNTNNMNSIDNNFQTIVVNNSINNNKISNKFFHELNNKLFSTSELKKYYSIYSKNVKNIGDIIKIFEKRCDEIKSNIYNMKLTFDSTISEQINNDKDILISNYKKMNLDEREDNFSYNYKIMHDEIIKLKQEKKLCLIILSNLLKII